MSVDSQNPLFPNPRRQRRLRVDFNWLKRFNFKSNFTSNIDNDNFYMLPVTLDTTE